MKRLLLIYNPTAGRQKVKTMLPTLLDVFAQNGYLTTVYPTKAKGDATDAAAALAPDFDRVVCCGGDGTLNETVTGLMKLAQDRRPVLGYIPTGSTNDFSRNLSLPRGTAEVAEVACAGVPRACDLGLVNGRWFTYVAAFGLFTDVSYATPQNAKNLLGHTAYLIEGASRLASIQSYHMKVESADHFVEGDFIYGMVGNTVSVGGLINLPKSMVKLDDGQFEILLVHKPKNPLDYQDIFRALLSQQLTSSGLVEGFYAGSVTFTSDAPVPWTLDGEFGGEHTALKIENQQQVLMLACGK